MLRLTIEKIVPGGVGLARVEGRVILVPLSAPGDVLEVELLDPAKNPATARIVRILEAGPARVKPPCPLYGRCGGCQLQHLHLAAQRQAKESMVAESLARIGRFRDPLTVLPILPEPRRRYRVRASLKARFLDGRLLLGFYEANSRRVVEVDSCPLLDSRLDALIDPLRILLAGLSLRDQTPQVDLVAGDGGVGMVLHILARETAADAERLLSFAQEQGLAQLWLQGDRKDSARLLTGEQALAYTVDGFELTFDPRDFIQSNLGQNHALVAQAMARVGDRPGRVVDLFCGIGNFTLPLSRLSGDVRGYEGDGRSVQVARENARRNGLEGIRFEAADLFRRLGLPDFGGVDTVLLDPPRNGAREAVMAIGAGGEVRRVVYVSCDAATFGRDAGILAKAGFVLGEVQPLDLFPWTRHVEMVAGFVAGN